MGFYIKVKSDKTVQLGGQVPLDDTWDWYDGPNPPDGATSFILEDGVIVESEQSASAREEALTAVTSAERKAKMLEGEDYNGTIVSFTKEDGDGLVQAKLAFELGIESTNLKFENGNTLPITKEEFTDFAIWFASKRNQFF